MFDIIKMETIGNNIRKSREKLGMSQKNLAELLNVTSPSLSNWERGKRLPDIENLIQLCKILKVSSDWILGIDVSKENNSVPKKDFVNSGKTNNAIKNDKNSELETDLLDNFRKLNKENKYRSITNVIDLLESQTEINKETVKKEEKMEA